MSFDDNLQKEILEDFVEHQERFGRRYDDERNGDLSVTVHTEEFLGRNAEKARRYTERNEESERERKRKWKKEHRAEVRLQKKRYREAHREELNEWDRQWRKENPEKVAEQKRRAVERKMKEEAQR